MDPNAAVIQTHYNFLHPKIKSTVILNTHMQWIMVIYIFVAGEWVVNDRHEYPDVESCIQAQHRFTADNPDITEIRASCEQSE